MISSPELCVVMGVVGVGVIAAVANSLQASSRALFSLILEKQPSSAPRRADH